MLSVLFVSRRGTVRAPLACACLQHLGGTRFRAHAAGHPAEAEHEVHPLALAALRAAHISVDGLHPQSWDVFRRSGAPPLDFVIMLDRSVAEREPAWPGQPERAFWAYEDLLAQDPPADGPQFTQTLLSLRRRLELLVNLARRPGTRAADLRSDVRDMAYLA